MRRRLFTLASALSLLLSAVAVMMWDRGGTKVDTLGVDGGAWEIRAEFGEGGLAAYYFHRLDRRPGPQLRIRPYAKLGEWTNAKWNSRFSYSEAPAIGRKHEKIRVSSVTIPYWAIVVVFAVAPLVHVAFGRIQRARRLLRLRRNTCAACGYDLRSSHDRCPECGTPRRSGAGNGVGSPTV